MLQQSRYCSLTTHWPIFFRRRHFPSMWLSNFSRYDILFSWFFHTIGRWSSYVPLTHFWKSIYLTNRNKGLFKIRMEVATICNFTLAFTIIHNHGNLLYKIARSKFSSCLFLHFVRPAWKMVLASVLFKNGFLWISLALTLLPQIMQQAESYSGGG